MIGGAAIDYVRIEYKVRTIKRAKIKRPLILFMISRSFIVSCVYGGKNVNKDDVIHQGKS